MPSAGRRARAADGPVSAPPADVSALHPDPYRSIDAQVSRLRKKIETGLRSPKLIKSVRGVGYVFTGKVETVAV